MSSDSDSDIDFTVSNNPSGLRQNFFKKFKSSGSPNNKFEISSDSEDSSDSISIHRKLRKERKKQKVSSRDTSSVRLRDTSSVRSRDTSSVRSTDAPSVRSRNTSSVRSRGTSTARSLRSRETPPGRTTRSTTRRRNFQNQSTSNVFDCLPSTSGGVRSANTDSNKIPMTKNKNNNNKKKSRKDLFEESTDEECKENLYKNIPVLIKVLWKSNELKKFLIKRFIKLSLISDYFARTYQVDPRLLFFTIDDKEINLNNSTYITLRLNNKVIIEGGVLPETYLNKENLNREEKTGLKVKIQYEERKSFFMYLKPEDRLEMVYSESATKLNLPYGKIRVLYDGETVRQSATVDDLEIEDGDVFDIAVV